MCACFLASMEGQPRPALEPDTFVVRVERNERYTTTQESVENYEPRRIIKQVEHAFPVSFVQPYLVTHKIESASLLIHTKQALGNCCFLNQVILKNTFSCRSFHCCFLALGSSPC